MINKDIKRLCRAVIKFLADKPSGKYETIAHIWDRVIVGALGGMLGVTAFMTNNAGALMILIMSLFVLLAGMYLISKGGK